MLIACQSCVFVPLRQCPALLFNVCKFVGMYVSLLLTTTQVNEVFRRQANKMNLALLLHFLPLLACLQILVVMTMGVSVFMLAMVWILRFFYDNGGAAANTRQEFR